MVMDHGTIPLSFVQREGIGGEFETLAARGDASEDGFIPSVAFFR